MSDHSTSPPPLGPEETDDLAGEYVLGTLSAEQRLDVERRLQENPKLQEAIWAWERRLQPYTAMVEPITPSSRLWQRITRTLDDRETSRSSAEERATPPGGLLNRLWHDLTLWRGVSLASIVVAIGLAAMLALGPGQTPSSRYLVVLMTPQHTQAGWIVQASSPQRISLKPIGTFEVPPGKALEFWTKADDWSGPVSLGLVEPGETKQLSLDDLPPLEDNQLFELTLEDDSGSPLDRPTGPIQFIGRAVEL
ncbi:anti-sigma factor [Salinicola sp. CR57]|uniref:anti-sigma factor n=1 Tax=Salinicola sp. CR57 TaxID=1949086 RepID=UPI000DA15A4B|nr:anti-sigma factor [Salinicola sp. CR57]